MGHALCLITRVKGPLLINYRALILSSILNGNDILSFFLIPFANIHHTILLIRHTQIKNDRTRTSQQGKIVKHSLICSIENTTNIIN